MIVGIDEVGRGCLAGPLCVAAVAIEDGLVKGLTDSKLITKKRREMLNPLIKVSAAGVGIGWVSARRIDKIGLSAALRLAANQALNQIKCSYDSIIIDGTVNFISPKPAVIMKQADKLVPSVSAASIIAKVARDNYMQLIDGHFPNYGFKSHVGYGTAAHLLSLEKFGPCDLHRLSFAPLATASEKTISAGSLAEKIAAEHLRALGFKVIERNWKTKWCEVDIIVQKQGIIHFVEVKYRRIDTAGRGLDYITKAKLAQMKFAAELWVKQKKYDGAYQLSAIELDGHPPRVSRFELEVLGR